LQEFRSCRSSGVAGVQELQEFRSCRSSGDSNQYADLPQKIIAMYAQGMTVREIQRFLEEQYKVEVSADHRLGLRGCHRMAKPAVGVDVSGGFL
jgi:hypothetical protein